MLKASLIAGKPGLKLLESHRLGHGGVSYDLNIGSLMAYVKGIYAYFLLALQTSWRPSVMWDITETDLQSLIERLSRHKSYLIEAGTEWCLYSARNSFARPIDRIAAGLVKALVGR